MSCSRYRFSKESYPHLQKFLDKVSSIPQESKRDDNISLWGKLMPKQTDLLDKIQKHASEQISEEIIDLLSVSESKSEKGDISMSISPNTSILINNSTIEDYSDKILRHLKSNGCVSKDVLTNVQAELSEGHLEELFKKLAGCEDKELVFTLGQMLVDDVCSEHKYFAKYYCEHILITELQEEDRERTSELFHRFLEKYPDVTYPAVSNNLVNLKECRRGLQENLVKLSSDHKQKLLSDFVLKCTKIQEAHFRVIECLIESRTDLGILKKLTSLISNVSNEFSTNRKFGKFLLTLVQKAESNVSYFEQDMRNIIGNHHSPWRIEVLRTFEANSEKCTMMSQTMHF